MQKNRLAPILVLLAVAPIPADFESIKKEIETYERKNPGQTLTAENIISRLPDAFRSSFSLMYKSESLQQASNEAPRVIMFGEDARTVMAFNGNPEQSSYTRLEFASFDAVSQELAFRMIEFPKDDSDQGKAVFSEKNPPLCMACHGPTPHYIWGQYAQWPGSYGSRDDVLDLTAGEKEGFLRFREAASAHPRYRSLLFPFDAQSPVAPYRPLQAGRPGTDRGDYKVAIEFRPNFRLGTLLMRHQAQVRAAAIIRSPEFLSHRYGFTFYLTGCHDKFKSPFTASMNQTTGFHNHTDYASRFDQQADRDWHLEKGGFAASIYDYSPALSSFRSGLLGHLWSQAFTGDQNLKPYWKPIRISDYVRSFDSIGFKISETGQSMWEAIDDAGPAPSGVPGSFEADNYGKLSRAPMLSVAEGLELCRILAQKHQLQ